MKKKRKPSDDEWIKISERPPWTGTYQVKYQRGVCYRFYTGLEKPAWIPIGLTESVMEHDEQPTHWRFDNEYSFIDFRK